MPLNYKLKPIKFASLKSGSSSWISLKSLVKESLKELKNLRDNKKLIKYGYILMIDKQISLSVIFILYLT